MALEAKLSLKLGQTLLMTPQLQQAIKLLQLGRLEYQEAIEKELLENPILEESKEEDPQSFSAETPTTDRPLVEEPPTNSSADSNSGEKTPVEWNDYLESFTDWRGSATPRGTVDYEDRPSLEATLTRQETLCDYLIDQLRLLEITNEDRDTILHIIGNLSRDGFLCVSYEEVAESAKCNVDDVKRAVGIVKNLDPIGVGARDLQECLLFQLENLGLENSLETRIIRDHIDKLEKRKYDQIAKSEEVDLDTVYKAVTTIQTLEPRPARNFADDATRYVIPDIYVYKISGEWVISLNEDGLPKLRVSPFYLKLLKDQAQENVPNKTYLNERLKAATWLIKSIHQRQNTIFRVTESIVKFQTEFLDHGVEKLKPLVLKEVADDIGMHESTVSRVTTNKFVHTPQGVFELKYFFTTGIKTTGGDVSSSAIKEKIKNLIAAESPSDPISDQKIVELLKSESIDIARRTVAKYREALHIESSSRRKKLF